MRIIDSKVYLAEWECDLALMVVLITHLESGICCLCNSLKVFAFISAMRISNKQ